MAKKKVIILADLTAKEKEFLAGVLTVENMGNSFKVIGSLLVRVDGVKAFELVLSACRI
jgi:hypothetical protein